jgi:DNA-binding transcriptional LysR family regulator
MDRLASLTAFVRVVESGGFTAAARRLDLSPTMVSNHVRDLENALGVRLLNRTTRRVSLTEIGREYYERSAQILHELDEADQVASALQLTPRGQLRIYCHAGVGRFIAPVVSDFLDRYPEVSLDLRIGDPYLIDLVQEGYDLAVGPALPSDSTLVRRRLAGWRYLLCCAPSYLEKHPEIARPADLADHNCILYAYSMFGSEWPFRDRGGNRVVVHVKGNLLTTSAETMRAVAVAGGGLWLCPPFIVSDLLGSGALVSILRDWQAPESELVAAYPHRRYLPVKVRAFIDRLVDRFARDPDWFDAGSSEIAGGFR